MDAKAIKELEKLIPDFCHKHGYMKPCGTCNHIENCFCCQGHEQTRAQLIECEEIIYRESGG